MPVIPKDEIEDAQHAAEQYGYGEGDFAFHLTQYAPLRPGPAPIVADVEATHTLSGISKTYNAGSGSSWPADFALDVEAGRFGVIVGARNVPFGKTLRSVEVRATGLGVHKYQVKPETGDVFGVEASNDAELLESIVTELQRRDSSAP